MEIHQLQALHPIARRAVLHAKGKRNSQSYAIERFDY